MPDNDKTTALVWAALDKAAGKEKRRELLQPGAKHNVSLELSGAVDGQAIDRRQVAGVLSIGHDSTRASSSGPAAGEVLGYLLAKLNPKTREKILRTLPEEFAAGGGKLPAVDADIVAAAENLLGRLRNKVTKESRGAVNFSYTVKIDD